MIGFEGVLEDLPPKKKQPSASAPNIEAGNLTAINQNYDYDFDEMSKDADKAREKGSISSTSKKSTIDNLDVLILLKSRYSLHPGATFSSRLLRNRQQPHMKHVTHEQHTVDVDLGRSFTLESISTLQEESCSRWQRNGASSRTSSSRLTGALNSAQSASKTSESHS